MNTLLTYSIALAGVGLFFLAELPLPWLFGPIFASLFAALLGCKLQVIKVVQDGMRTILGVAVGATITISLLLSMLHIWPSLLLVILVVIVIGLVGVPFFMRVGGYDFATSYYAAMPGGLQDMLLFGEEAGANVRTLSLIHATRVLLIVMALPFILEYQWQVDLSNTPSQPISETSLDQLVWMAIASLVGWRIATRIGMFGSSILGPMILATLLTLVGLLHERPPAEAIWAAQFFIGAGLGSKYVGISLKELRHDISIGIIFCLLLGIITFIFFQIGTWLNLAPAMELLLAFTPGGQAELTVLALVVGADLGFVLSHHVLRMFVVILGAPLVARLIKQS